MPKTKYRMILVNGVDKEGHVHCLGRYKVPQDRVLIMQHQAKGKANKIYWRSKYELVCPMMQFHKDLI